MSTQPAHLTTSSGSPVQDNENSITAGQQGPIVLHDYHLIQKLADFNRERVPERVVHAKGHGAFGVLKVTEDVSQYTKAQLFQPGVTTRSLARFSIVAGESGYPDTCRDVRGFAIKFYTQEGNYDLVGNNTPVFFVRDPFKFPDFIRSQKRMPDSKLRDNNMQWDFWTLSPESAHQVAYLMGDRGLPKSLRHMNGYGSHTYQWINADGERFWVKYHFISEQGVEFLTDDEGTEIAGKNPDHHRQDLFEAIARGDYPSWTLKVQVMPVAEAAKYKVNPFDLTKVWSHKDYPLITVGTWTLNENPQNFFAQVEQAAFAPSNTVPGIGFSPDKMLLGRVFSYADAARYRVGVNHDQLPVNKPIVTPHHYYQDGAMAYEWHDPQQPVYHPNSYNGPVAHKPTAADPGAWDFSGGLDQYPQYVQHKEDDDFAQAHDLVRNVMDDAERERLVKNVVGHISAGVKEPVLSRVFQYWKNIDEEVGKQIEKSYKETTA